MVIRPKTRIGPLSRFRLRLAALPVRFASGMVMAGLAMAFPGGSARSGALQAAAGGVPHARPAAASVLTRGKAMGTGEGS